MVRGESLTIFCVTDIFLRHLHRLNPLTEKQQIAESIVDVEFAGIEPCLLIKTLETAINLPKVLRHFTRRVELE